MANKNPKNVKRFVEDISKEVASKAYNGGGGGSANLDGLYPNTKILELNQNLLDIEGASADDYAYIKLSDLKTLLEEKMDLSSISIDSSLSTEVPLTIYLMSAYLSLTDSEPKMQMSNGCIQLVYEPDSSDYYFYVDVNCCDYLNTNIFTKQIDVTEAEVTTFEQLLDYVIAIEDVEIKLAVIDSSEVKKITDGLEEAIGQPFFTSLSVYNSLDANELTFYAHLDIDKLIANIHYLYEETEE